MAGVAPFPLSTTDFEVVAMPKPQRPTPFAQRRFDIMRLRLEDPEAAVVGGAALDDLGLPDAFAPAEPMQKFEEKHHHQACDMSTAPPSPAGVWSRCTSSSTLPGVSPRGQEQLAKAPAAPPALGEAGPWAARLNELKYGPADGALGARASLAAEAEDVVPEEVPEPAPPVTRVPFAQKMSAHPPVAQAPPTRPLYAKAIARAEPQRPTPFAQRRFAVMRLRLEDPEAAAAGGATLDDLILPDAAAPAAPAATGSTSGLGDWRGVAHELREVDDDMQGQEDEGACARVPFAQKLGALHRLDEPRRAVERRAADQPQADETVEVPKATSFTQKRQEIRGLWDVELDHAHKAVDIPCAADVWPTVPGMRAPQACLLSRLLLEEELMWFR